MPITFVNWKLIYIGHKLDLVLAKATSSYYQSIVQSGSSSWHFFTFEFIMTNLLQNIINKFDWLMHLINLMG